MIPYEIFVEAFVSGLLDAITLEMEWKQKQVTVKTAQRMMKGVPVKIQNLLTQPQKEIIKP